MLSKGVSRSLVKMTAVPSDKSYDGGKENENPFAQIISSIEKFGFFGMKPQAHEYTNLSILETSQQIQ